MELAKGGYSIYAVEPNIDMRKQLTIITNPFQNVQVINGSAEKTTLKDHSIDIITIAHALHWFDLNNFKTECQRILKPGGYIIAIYNHVPGKEMTDFCKATIDNFFLIHQVGVIPIL